MFKFIKLINFISFISQSDNKNKTKLKTIKYIAGAVTVQTSPIGIKRSYITQ